MEQQAHQLLDQPRKLGGATGKGFMPGQSGNPLGRGSPKVRAAREAAELAERVGAEARLLVNDFATRYGRPPSASEAARIGACALLAVRLREPSGLDAEHTVRMANGLERALRRAGLGQAPAREAAATDTDVPWPMVGERK